MTWQRQCRLIQSTDDLRPDKNHRKERYMDIIKVLQEELNIGRNQVEAAVKLIDEGNTIPFIARYRKEATGSLDDEVLRNLDRSEEHTSELQSH